MSASTVAIGSIGMVSPMKSQWEVSSTGGVTTVGMYSTAATTTTTVAAGKTYGLRFDSSTGVLEYKNITDAGSWTSLATGLTATPYFQYCSTAAATTAVINSGSKTLAETPTSGFSALCTANLPIPSIPKPAKYFNAKTRTGTGASYSVVGELFQPDLVWSKGRSGATDHAIYDSIRGVQKDIGSNLATDQTTQTTGLTAFNVDGYSGGSWAKMNTNAATYIDWMWKEGVTPGLDIVQYTGNGSNRAIAHNLGVTPKKIIIHAITTAGADQGWPVWNTTLAGTEYMLLNSDAGKAVGATVWNSSTPTPDVFSVGTSALTNTNGDTYIAYLFAEVDGFSKFGSYAGNSASDGTFVYTGFKPRFIEIKKSSGIADWAIYDTARGTYNVIAYRLWANLSLAETTATSGYEIDILSNGFKLRANSGGTNTTGDTYTFSAFAESPFKYATAR